MKAHFEAKKVLSLKSEKLNDMKAIEREGKDVEEIQDLNLLPHFTRLHIDCFSVCCTVKAVAYFYLISKE